MDIISLMFMQAESWEAIYDAMVKHQKISAEVGVFI